MKNRPVWILPIIVISQFTGTSLWFAGNAVLDDIQRQWSLGESVIGYMTSVVQLGFIAGTLCFAVLAVSDRFSPRKVFFFCSLLGAFANLLVYLIADGFTSLMVLRGLTGFFLAGIYPVGMKIASGWYRQGLGKALGFLVGALVLGTAFPHVFKGSDQSIQWETVIIAISLISAGGGALMYVLVPDGPYLFRGTSFDGKALKLIFERQELRAAAFGYFGHMWELYTLWAFVPMFLITYATHHPASEVKYILVGFHHHCSRQHWLHWRGNAGQKIRQCEGRLCSTRLFRNLLPSFGHYFSGSRFPVPGLLDFLGYRRCWRFTPVFNPCGAHRYQRNLSDPP